MGWGSGVLQWRQKTSLSSKTTTKPLSPQPRVNAGQAAAFLVPGWDSINTISLLATLVANTTSPDLGALLVQLHPTARFTFLL